MATTNAPQVADSVNQPEKLKINKRGQELLREFNRIAKTSPLFLRLFL